MTTKTFAWALLWIVMIALLFACLAAIKSNGATDNPLLVNEITPSKPDAPLPAWMLNAPCGKIDRRNLPIVEERNA